MSFGRSHGDRKTTFDSPLSPRIAVNAVAKDAACVRNEATVDSMLSCLPTVSATVEPFAQQRQVLALADEFCAALESVPFPKALAEQALLPLTAWIRSSERHRGTALQGLNKGLAEPVDQFVRKDLAALRDLGAMVQADSVELQDAQLKYDIAKSSRSKPKEVEKLREALQILKRRYGLLNVNYNTQLEDAGQRPLDILDSVCAFGQQYAAQLRRSLSDWEAISSDIARAREEIKETMESHVAQRSEKDLAEIVESQLAAEVLSKQGYLEVGTIKKNAKLKKRWVVTRDGMLNIFKSWKDHTNPLQTLDLEMCSMRVVDEGACKFQLLSPRVQFLMRAASRMEMKEWMEVLQQGIARRLGDIQKKSSQGKNSGRYLERVIAADPSNAKCADCASDNVEWASINLGVVICSQCSGSHRALGTHISRVRSLTIDNWDELQFGLMLEIGNEFANSVWEHDPVHLQKRSSGGAASKEQYIKLKYADKAFLKPGPPKADMMRSLAAAIGTNDYHRAYFCFAHGMTPQNGKENISLLHACIQDGRVSSQMFEYCLLNTPNLRHVSPKNGGQQNALHFAARANNPRLAKLLLDKGLSFNEGISGGPSPMEVARRKGSQDVVQLFETGEYVEQTLTVQELVNSVRRRIIGLKAELQREPNHNRTLMLNKKIQAARNILFA